MEQAPRQRHASPAVATLESMELAPKRRSCARKCLSAPNVFALVGKKATDDANLTASELPWLGTSILLYLMDPAATCAALRDGRWTGQVRAFFSAFSSGNPTAGPVPEKVAELLRGVQRNYRPEDTHEPCVDASRILEESAKLSAQVVRNMAGRVLAVAVLPGLHLPALRQWVGEPNIGG
ncbi:zinc transporter ZIP4-like [Alligator sinensis]|uniref:Zinc transporter ZIP4-like n=1 Tax=Alligator sinensis TaxID=38654 RepID=A0A3Q0FTB1_ALLSI|nr:zinc transporter ZIP4-like [Alligator sinensis]